VRSGDLVAVIGSDRGGTTMALESTVLQNTAASERTEADLQCRIRAEYEEMPGLKLTLPQALRLFNYDAVRCQHALSQLVAAGVLSIDDGSFVLAPRRVRVRSRDPRNVSRGRRHW
jgi:hypothetical protein